MIALRYSPGGNLDFGFSGDGRTAIAFQPAKAESDYAFDVAIAPGAASALIAGRTQEQTAGADQFDSDIALVSMLLAGPPDADYDGVANAQDGCPLRRGPRPHGCPDTDGDGTADHADPDDDGDGVADKNDVAPLDRTRWLRPATAGADTIFGGPLADTIRGLGGDDKLSGAGGADKLFGGAGKDTLLGGGGNDKLVGGKGDDRLGGGPGVNSYAGGAGNDTIKARNGEQETVRCGKGSKDVATVDETDAVAGCETVKRPG